MDSNTSDILSFDSGDLPAIEIMIVDDEQSILNSLQRLLFDMDCNIRTSTSGHEALQALQDQAADIVISDMRMAGMDGVEFLNEVASRWSETERILLTGYADLESTIGAINKGKINFYMEKPWDDDRLRRIVQKGISISHGKHRTQLLEEKVKRQNEQLKELNEDLEKKVAERSKDLAESNSKLQSSLDQLKVNYQQTTNLFSSLIEQRMGNSLISKQNLMLLLKKMAELSELEKDETRALIYAGILRNLGKVSFPDKLIKRAYLDLDVQEQRDFQTHISIAENMMSSMPPLKGAAKIISQRHEQLDGQGYPKGLYSQDISTEAKILSVVSDLLLYCQGLIETNCLSIDEALGKLKEQSGSKYDPLIVEQLCTLQSELKLFLRDAADKYIKLDQLQAGMCLQRDLVASNGATLLAEGVEIDQEMIARLKSLAAQMEEELKVYVKEPE
ncbi:HD domain-containing phosphohydrolase [uncultured Pseudoteredinibacter sp.]|uniref:HD domain-containing phosphohydrolase n=1 Tax=uncultured Pseudoteredinibacter sp. TaxID=1641701 RepID=UPI00260D969D|nr:HD domain-containing phosphohydrolase [uncultured Pseudoteredinibacter sp.]